MVERNIDMEEKNIKRQNTGPAGNRVELLAPAGNLEKLKIAILFGADAVYCGGYNYGLREGADNFTMEELKEAVEFAHRHQARVYVTVNMIPHNEDLVGLPEYLHQLEELGVDALIVSDPGVISIVKEEGIKVPLHLSTQANTVNWASVRFWQEQGIERIILARELSREEIKEIREKTEIELEMFVHGAMCISYSGRCLLSNYMAARDANRGMCAHSCRWKYYLVEERRPGQYFPIFEDEHGTYIMNSRDLCLIEHIPEVIGTGVNSLKIEGRMKSLHYVATVTSVYRKALDSYYQDPENYRFREEWLKELHKISNRDYTTGFFFNRPGPEAHNYGTSSYQRDYDFMGVVRDFVPYKGESRSGDSPAEGDSSAIGEALVEVRHKFFRGDRLEIFGPDCDPFEVDLSYIINEEGEKVEEAGRARELIRIPVTREVKPFYLVRREKN